MLDYIATYPNLSVNFYKPDMHLCAASNASYLSISKAYS